MTTEIKRGPLDNDASDNGIAAENSKRREFEEKRIRRAHVLIAIE
jgi:hypothetical protein